MATQKEEVIISIGVEQKAIEGELQSLRDKFHTFGQSVKGIFTSVFGQIGAERVVEKILSGMSAVMEKAKQIKAQAYAQGTSTDFVQDIQNVGKAAGVSADSIETMMDKFIKGLPAGSDVEKSFLAMADRLEGIKDPAERARIATEAFGKSGIDMIKIAGHGSEALEKMASKFDKLSESEIQIMENADRFKQKGESWLSLKYAQLWEGAAIWKKHLSSFSPSNFHPKSLGSAMIDTENEMEAEIGAEKDARRDAQKIEKLKIILEHNQEIAEARWNIKKATAEEGTTGDKYLFSLQGVAKLESEIAALKGDELAQDKLQPGLIEERAKAEKLRLEMVTEADKKKKDALLLEREILKHNASVYKELIALNNSLITKTTDLQRRKEDEFNPSLDQMADTNNPYNKTAWQLRQNMEWAKFDKLHGNKDAFAGDLERIQSLRDTLTKAGVYEDPNRALIDELSALLNPDENGGGLPVQLPFG